MNQIDLFTGGVFGDTCRRNGHSKRSSRKTSQPLEVQIVRLTEVIEGQQEQIDQLQHLVRELSGLISAKKTVKESYTTMEVAAILGKKPYTVREWCRLQRVAASKAMCGRGCEEEWRISHEELERIQNEGLLPVPERY